MKNTFLLFVNNIIVIYILVICIKQSNFCDNIFLNIFVSFVDTCKMFLFCFLIKLMTKKSLSSIFQYFLFYVMGNFEYVNSVLGTEIIYIN